MEFFDKSKPITSTIGLVFLVIFGPFIFVKVLLEHLLGRNDAVDYQRDDQTENFALALAHPISRSHFNQRQFFSENQPNTEVLDKLAPLLRDFLAISRHEPVEQIQKNLAERIGAEWYRIDVAAIRDADDPQGLLALACARVAFVVRCAGLLGWIDEDLQWRILHLNAERAKDCFASWKEFGDAYVIGRQQWVAQSRSEPLGQHTKPSEIEEWTRKWSHPWHKIKWPNRALQGETPIEIEA